MNKAVEYYLETQEYDSENRIAKRALEFIKKNTGPEALVNFVRSGKIKRFYPPLGLRPAFVLGVFSGVLAACAFAVVIVFAVTPSLLPKIERADLSSFVLTLDE